MAQLLTECLVLALAGSALGLLVAAAGSAILRTMAKSLPRAEEISLDWRIALYTLACAFLATVLCGLFPALRGTRRSLASELAGASRTQVSTRNPLQWLLIGVQVALAVTLLVGAGLLLRSFEELGRVSPGFETSHILTFRISGNYGETVEYKKLIQRIDHTLDDLRAIPGVQAAATTGSLPGIPGDSRTELRLTERHDETVGKMVADSRIVSAGYFATIRIPLMEGQTCSKAAKNPFAIVNRSFANAYLSESSGLGQHLQPVSNLSFSTPFEIRGIVGDAREQGLNQAPVPTVYWCASAPGPSPYFLIRTRGEPMAMAATIRRKIFSIEPARSVFDMSPLEEHLSDSFAETRLRTILLTLFALTAILLVCVGLYGTLNYFVTVRRREIGLRLALGALRLQIARQFLFKGVTVAMAGCAVGLCLATVFTRWLAGMLFGVSAFDPRTFGFVVLLILVVAAAASLLPALRAAHVEPMRVLRDE